MPDGDVTFPETSNNPATEAVFLLFMLDYLKERNFFNEIVVI